MQVLYVFSLQPSVCTRWQRITSPLSSCLSPPQRRSHSWNSCWHRPTVPQGPGYSSRPQLQVYSQSLHNLFHCQGYTSLELSHHMILIPYINLEPLLGVEYINSNTWLKALLYSCFDVYSCSSCSDSYLWVSSFFDGLTVFCPWPFLVRLWN